MTDDLISRQYAIEHYQHVCRRTSCKECPLHIQVTDTLTDCELELFLHNMPSAEPEHNVHDLRKDADCISRQAVLEAIDEIESEVEDGDGFQYEKWRQWFCDLPSADVPERNAGKWLEKEVFPTRENGFELQSCKCSVCGRYDTRPYLYYFDEPRFCSWCGAEMKGEDK